MDELVVHNCFLLLFFYLLIGIVQRDMCSFAACLVGPKGFCPILGILSKKYSRSSLFINSAICNTCALMKILVPKNLYERNPRIYHHPVQMCPALSRSTEILTAMPALISLSIIQTDSSFLLSHMCDRLKVSSSFFPPPPSDCFFFQPQAFCSVPAILTNDARDYTHFDY